MHGVMSMYVKNVTIAPGLPYVCMIIIYAGEVCAYMGAYVRTCMRTYMRTCVRAHVRTRVPACASVCVGDHVRVYVFMSVCMCVHVRARACVRYKTR